MAKEKTPGSTVPDVELKDFQGANDVLQGEGAALAGEIGSAPQPDMRIEETPDSDPMIQFGIPPMDPLPDIDTPEPKPVTTTPEPPKEGEIEFDEAALSEAIKNYGQEVQTQAVPDQDSILYQAWLRANQEANTPLPALDLNGFKAWLTERFKDEEYANQRTEEMQKLIESVAPYFQTMTQRDSMRIQTANSQITKKIEALKTSFYERNPFLDNPDGKQLVGSISSVVERELAGQPISKQMQEVEKRARDFLKRYGVKVDDTPSPGAPLKKQPAPLGPGSRAGVVNHNKVTDKDKTLNQRHLDDLIDAVNQGVVSY